MEIEDKVEWWLIITCFISGMWIASLMYSKYIEAIEFLLATILSFLILSMMEKEQENEK